MSQNQDLFIIRTVSLIAVYQIDQLLILLSAEKAREMRFRAGHAPIVVSEEEQRPLLGPALMAEDVMRLLRSLATSRQIRDLRTNGSVQFIYTAPGRFPFLVRAKLEDDRVTFIVS